MRLTNWSAKRSGTGITVTGKGDSGKRKKLAGIAQLAPRSGAVIALGNDGREHELAVE